MSDIDEPKLLCVFCGEPYTEDMLKAYDGSYGCESGCSYMTIVVVCASCEREVYVKGDFGETSYSDWKAEVSEKEIADALKSGKEYDGY